MNSKNVCYFFSIWGALIFAMIVVRGLVYLSHILTDPDSTPSFCVLAFPNRVLVTTFIIGPILILIMGWWRGYE